MEKRLVCLISQEEIAAIVKRVAQELDRDYAHRSPVLVGMLKGAFIYLADLVRHMKTPIRNMEFIRLSSYGASTVSSGHAVVVTGLPKGTVTGQDVILVEDIVTNLPPSGCALSWINPPAGACRLPLTISGKRSLTVSLSATASTLTNNTDNCPLST